MRHVVGSDSHREVYECIGELTIRFSEIERMLSKLLVDLFPVYLMKWADPPREKFAQQKLDSLKKIVLCHGLLDQALKSKASQVFEAIKDLNEIRNSLVHAIEVIVAGEVIENRAPLCVQYEHWGTIRDTSPEKLSELMCQSEEVCLTVYELCADIVERLKEHQDYSHLEHDDFWLSRLWQ